MAEKLRRRARARPAGRPGARRRWLPSSGVRLALESASPLARFTRAERRMRANLELALGSELDAGRGARIGRGVRRHGARLVSEWLRLARQGDPQDPAALDRRARAARRLARRARAPARGRHGLLLVTAHLGNWSSCARACTGWAWRAR
jgi:lauroyl/myristoyl acyltransferase